MAISPHDEKIGFDIVGMGHQAISDAAIGDPYLVHDIIHLVCEEIFLQISGNTCRLETFLPKRGRDVHFLGTGKDWHGVSHGTGGFAAIVPGDHYPVC